jgi:hypothetical protein
VGGRAELEWRSAAGVQGGAGGVWQGTRNCRRRHRGAEVASDIDPKDTRGGVRTARASIVDSGPPVHCAALVERRARLCRSMLSSMRATFRC